MKLTITRSILGDSHRVVASNHFLSFLSPTSLFASHISLTTSKAKPYITVDPIASCSFCKTCFNSLSFSYDFLLSLETCFILKESAFNSSSPIPPVTQATAFLFPKFLQKTIHTPVNHTNSSMLYGTCLCISVEFILSRPALYNVSKISH